MGGVIPGEAGELGEHPGEGVDLFGVDGVAFEGHGGGADLFCPEGFGEFAERGGLQEAEVEGEFVEGGPQPGDGADDVVVLFAGVNLRGDGEEG